MMPITIRMRSGITRAISTAAAPRSNWPSWPKWPSRPRREAAGSFRAVTAGPRISVEGGGRNNELEQTLDRGTESRHCDGDHHSDQPDHERVLRRGRPAIAASPGPATTREWLLKTSMARL